MTNNPLKQGNFWFLRKEFPFLQNLAEAAEGYVYSDPAASLSKLRVFAEKLAGLVIGEHGLELPREDNLNNRLRLLKRETLLSEPILFSFHLLRDKGNVAAHDAKGTTDDAIGGLLNAFRLAKWLVQVYGEPGTEIPSAFRKPENLDARHALHVLQQDYSRLEALYKEQLELLKQPDQQRNKQDDNNLRLKAFQFGQNIPLTEAETREIIDEQLRKAGWEADTKMLCYAKGARPEKGKNKAIAEWPVKDGRADYALFIGEELFGMVEAKKDTKEVLHDMRQAKRYAIDAEESHGGNFLGKWMNYKVPFLFATNSRGYHFMLENRSGTWFLDGRKATNHPKALRGWFSPQDLQEMYAQDLKTAINDLQADPYDYLKDPKALALRYYQIEAIQAIERATADSEASEALLAMATGTGKTRTMLGMCYRLIKSKRFNRILFLVDRNLLGSQAGNAFKDLIIEDLSTFSKIYDIAEITDALPELDTKVHFATVQGMYRRIFDNDKTNEIPSPGKYDCVVVDEAHRGYALDREMDDIEIAFKDQSDYQSKYRQVLEYFNAFRIGMTATPAPHTERIFGKPVYEYSYKKAVADGFLVPYEPPYLIRTQLSEEGIVWEKGSTFKIYNRLTKEIEQLDNIEDEVRMDVEKFNKVVITEAFNRTVFQELVKHISPYGPEKTLIFAANDLHADDVVVWLTEEFEKACMTVDDDAIEKITGKTDKVDEMVKHYKNEQMPVIAVTVDLLSTGVDVEKICNLVFLRRVGSRILFEQMLGRATRLCDEIGKQSFRIFDAVGAWAIMEEFTNMKPVVVSPNANFQQLVDELDLIEQLPTDDQALATERQLEQIVAKLHRKYKHMKAEQAEGFKAVSGGLSPDDFIKALREKQGKDATQFLRSNKNAFKYLDEMPGEPTRLAVYEGKDVLREVTQSFYGAKSATDYLENFRRYLLDNRNKLAALDVVCTRPRSLTRQSLKELRFLLANDGYDDAHLNSAWHQAKNEDVAADIIAFIRTMALGSPLLSHGERIRNAMKKVRAMRQWTAVQRQWLDRFESQLISESILQKEDLDQGIFKNEGGGFARLDRLFGNELEVVLETINEHLYRETG